jgi:hypothetical protein
MDNITSEKKLKEAVSVLEKRQSEQYDLLKKQYHNTVEGLRPENIINSAISEFTQTNSFFTGILPSLFGLLAGYFSSKIFTVKSDNFLRKVSVAIFQLIISKIFALIACKVNKMNN